MSTHPETAKSPPFYESAVRAGLVLIIWFASWAHAAHDLWAACTVFFFVSLMTLLLLFGRSRDRKPIRIPLLTPSITLVTIFWLSLLHSYDKNATQLEAWGWTFALLIFYLGINVLDTAAGREAFFRGSGLAVIPMALYCLWQQLTGTTDSWGHWEIHGSLMNSVVLAGFALNWLFFFWSDRKKIGAYSSIFLAASALLLLLARSWWSLTAITAGALTLNWASFRSWMRDHGRATFFLIAFVLAAIGTMIGFKLHRHPGPYVGSSRFYYWWTTVSMWKSAPWTGIGLGGFATAFSFFKKGHTQTTLFAHSFVLQLLAEAGLAGVAAAVYWGGCLYRETRNHPNTDETVFPATLVAVLWFSFININLEYLLNKIIFLLVAAAWLGDRPIRSVRLRPIWALTAGLCIVGVAPFWIKLLVGSRIYTAGVQNEQRFAWANAQKNYMDAITVDPSLSDSYWRLALLDVGEWKAQHSPELLKEAVLYLDKAIYYKKDPLYFDTKKLLVSVIDRQP